MGTYHDQPAWGIRCKIIYILLFISYEVDYILGTDEFTIINILLFAIAVLIVALYIKNEIAPYI